jgi:CubicO group peptidase (beta-lactamase class C family)
MNRDESSDVRAQRIGEWLERHASNRPYRVVAYQGDRLIGRWAHGVSWDALLGMASAAKSLYSCLLGIAVAEGKIGSADDFVVDYYPEMMDVGENEGPKPGRHAFPKDHRITFRQLICNTSGYMKPDEDPGTVFHYQTFGMNILTHAIAKTYGYYDTERPNASSGCGKLIEEKIRNPIGGTWRYGYSNFQHAPTAKIAIFGNYTQIYANADDMARMGLLWLNGGVWDDVSVIPRDWLAESVRIAPDIRRHCPADAWKYGHGFWTNEAGILWPSLPTDSYAASGAGSKHIWVCPSLNLVVSQSPGLWDDQAENDTGVLREVVEAFG